MVILNSIQWLILIDTYWWSKLFFCQKWPGKSFCPLLCYTLQ